MSPADGTAGVGHLLELEAAGVAQTHVSTGVDDRVHRVLVADGALVGPRLPARREGGGLGEADGGTGGGSCGRRQEEERKSGDGDVDGHLKHVPAADRNWKNRRSS